MARSLGTFLRRQASRRFLSQRGRIKTYWSLPAADGWMNYVYATPWEVVCGRERGPGTDTWMATTHLALVEGSAREMEQRINLLFGKSVVNELKQSLERSLEGQHAHWEKERALDRHRALEWKKLKVLPKSTALKKKGQKHRWEQSSERTVKNVVVGESVSLLGKVHALAPWESWMYIACGGVVALREEGKHVHVQWSSDENGLTTKYGVGLACMIQDIQVDGKHPWVEAMYMNTQCTGLMGTSELARVTGKTGSLMLGRERGDVKGFVVTEGWRDGDVVLGGLSWEDSAHAPDTRS